MLTNVARLPVRTLAALERRHWFALAGLALLASCLAAFLLWRSEMAGAGADARAAPGIIPRLDGQAPPDPEPLEFRPIAPQDAVAINAATPHATLPSPAAAAFDLAGASPLDRARALDCLTAAVYYEAAVEATEGQRAVAQVVLNRARHPAYPNSVCGVVYQGAERRTGCQFTFTCDGSLRRPPTTAGWVRARQVAEAALNGFVFAPVGWATHYHANYVLPYWSSSLVKLATVGTHIFYRWSGGWGTPRAFTSRYAAAEPVILEIGDLTVDLPPEELDPALVEAPLTDGSIGAGSGGPVQSFRTAVIRLSERSAAAPPAVNPAVATAAPPARQAAAEAAPPAQPTAYRSALVRPHGAPAAPQAAAASAPQVPPQAEAPPAPAGTAR